MKVIFLIVCQHIFLAIPSYHNFVWWTESLNRQRERNWEQGSSHHHHFSKNHQEYQCSMARQSGIYSPPEKYKQPCEISINIAEYITS
jgi:hypothetical protein